MTRLKCWMITKLIVVIVAVTAGRHPVAAETGDADLREDGAGRPVAPVPSCVVYNWELMVCTWQRNETGIKTNYWMRYTIGGTQERCKRDHNTGNSNECPASGEVTCTWKGGRLYSKFTEFCILMFANNSHGIDVRSQFIPTSTTGENVKPNAVSNLRAFNVTTTAAVVQWEMSKFVNCHLFCRANFTGADGWQITIKYAVEEANAIIRVRRRVTDLRPYTNYVVTVECRPGNESTERGFWSDPSAFNFTTLADVPASAPRLTEGSFRSLERPGLLDVRVFWQPIPRQQRNGIINTCVRYCIAASDNSTYSSALQVENQPLSKNNSSTTANHNVSHVTDATLKPPPCVSVCVDGNRTSCVLSNLSTSLDYLVDVNSNTSAGFNKSLNLRQILIPATNNKPGFPKFYSATRDSNSSVTVHWLSITGAVQYTVYWCEQTAGSYDDCAAPIRWQTADGSMTSLGIGTITRSFGFVMSVEFANSSLSGAMYSSGMPSAWSHCVYSADKLPAMPQRLHLPQHQTERSLRVEWQAIDCAQSGHISHFIISYCRKDQCKQRSVENVGPAVSSATIPGLEPEGSYRIRIKSWSYAGESNYSEWIEGTVIASVNSWSLELVMATVGPILAILIALSILVFICMNFERIKQWLHVPIVIPDKNSEYRRKLVSVSSGDSSSSSNSSKSREPSPDIVSIESGRAPSYEQISFFALKQPTKLGAMDTSVINDSYIPQDSATESDRLVDGYLTPTQSPSSPSPQSTEVVTNYSECTFTTETKTSPKSTNNSNDRRRSDGKAIDVSGNSENVPSCSSGYTQLDTGSDEELSADESSTDEYLPVHERVAVGDSAPVSSIGNNYTQCALDNSEDYEEDLTTASPLVLFPNHGVPRNVHAINPACRILPLLSGNIAATVPNYFHVDDLALGSDEDGPDVVIVDGRATEIENNDSGTSGVASDRSDYAVIGVVGSPSEGMADETASYSIVQTDNFSDVSDGNISS